MTPNNQFSLVLRGLVEAAGDPIEPRFATDISAHLFKEHGAHVHWRTIEALLRPAKEFAKSSKQNGRWVFVPSKTAVDFIKGDADTIQLIDPGKAVIATARLHDTLSSLSGLVRLCDPYLDHISLQHLDAIPAKTTIRFLSFNITDTGTTRSLVSAFSAKGVALEIRKAHGGVLHDRYIIAGNRVLILGTSLNGFGKKQCFVIRAGQSIAQSLTKTFDELWGKGTPWP
jgi:hypothetical protein